MLGRVDIFYFFVGEEDPVEELISFPLEVGGKWEFKVFKFGYFVDNADECWIGHLIILVLLMNQGEKVLQLELLNLWTEDEVDKCEEDRLYIVVIDEFKRLKLWDFIRV